MTSRLLLFFCISLLFTTTADAQMSANPEISSPRLPERLAGIDLTDAEQAVLETIAEDGVHVVHLWAPWCGNSIRELREGFHQVIENHPEVSFTFVTVWNLGESGRETLTQYNIPESIPELLQDDPGQEPEDRRRVFLSLPVTWVPTTWIFHRNGQLAYAFNYGEVSPELLETALELTTRSW